MNTNSSAPRTLYIGLDVHKEKTSVAILDSERSSEPRHYGDITTSHYALERAMKRIVEKQNRFVSISFLASSFLWELMNKYRITNKNYKPILERRRFPSAS